MRVFAPRRCCGQLVRNPKTSGFNYPYRSWWYGIPLSGEWVDVPDYFVQATSGREVNDVVHAKIVDPTGFTYTKWDQFVTYRGNVYPYPQVVNPTLTSWSGSGWQPVRHLSIAPSKVIESTVLVDPSKNYKGKKSKRKPYKQTVHTRVVYGAYVQIGLHASRVREGARYVYYGYPDITVYSLYKEPKETDSFAQVVYTRWSFTRSSGIWLPQTGADGHHHTIPPELYSFCSQLDNQPKHKSYAKAAYWAADAAESLVLGDGERLHSWVNAQDYQYGVYQWSILQCTDQPITDHYCQRAFLMHEDSIIGSRIDPLLVRGDMGNYWRNYLCEHALLEACESLPRLSDNSIQNLVEIVGFIKGVVVDHRIEMPKSLADAWLAYRYSYGTGKQDIEDAIKFVRRHTDLGTLDRLIVGRGVSRHTFSDGTDVLCRCQVGVKPKQVDQLHRIWRALDTYGLTPDFYVVWDSIPYSFMVDWFLPIGDLAGVWDANSKYFSGEFYTFSNLCYSLTYTRDLDDVKVKCYTRWAGSVPSSLNSFYWFEPPSASGQTVVKRILDAGSIFIG